MNVYITSIRQNTPEHKSLPAFSIRARLNDENGEILMLDYLENIISEIQLKQYTLLRIGTHEVPQWSGIEGSSI